MSAPQHPEADQILQKLSREGIEALYHFTSVENLGSIRDMKALCSKQTLQGAGLWPSPEPGGNELSHSLDRYNNNWDKLSLNLTPYTPMAYRKKRSSHLCFFVLKADVACLEGVVFTDTNAASTGGQRREQGLAGLQLVDFEAVRSSPRPWDKDGWFRHVQAEILVPHHADLSSVIEVGFVSKASLEDAERVWGNHPHPPFRVKPDYFSDRPHSVTLSFPCLLEILLTDELVDKARVGRLYSHKTRFNRGTSERVTVVASVYAVTGTKAEVTWRPGGLSSTTEFEKSSDWWHWPNTPIGSLPDGTCSVEYRLAGVRWATLEFEVSS